MLRNRRLNIPDKQQNKANNLQNSLNNGSKNSWK